MMFGNFNSKASLKTLTSMKSPRHPRNGWMVVVGGIASQITKMKVDQRDMLEEALKTLYRFDATPPKQSETSGSTLE
jgi:hypothetical protein